MTHRIGIFGIVLVFLCLVPRAVAAPPAFPGAEGYGASASGGRGGTIYYVTSLYDYTSSADPNRFGTLRYGIASASGPRTILFQVSGTIELMTDLSINKPNLTIAGQTAPGDGITLKRRGARVNNTSNVILRHLRFRPGDVDGTFEGDALWIVNSTNVIADHISSSWSVDECFSVTWSTNVTVQWCLIAESLKNSQHAKGAHGYGSLLRYANGGLSFHHNLYAHHDSRNPRLGDNLTLDWVNNVIYNWGGRAGYSGADSADNPNGFTNRLNYINNYLIAGPSSTTPRIAFAGGATNTVIYQSGNLIDTNKTVSRDGANTGWAMFQAPYSASSSPFAVPPVTAEAAPEAYLRVLGFAGASQARDATDRQVISNAWLNTGRLVDAVGPTDQANDYATNQINGTNYVFVRGWPALATLPAPADSDGDGIPDYFEQALDWNPAGANNNNTNTDGYTDLEWYLNWLARPHAVTGKGQPVDINLREITGLPMVTFGGFDGTNGSAALLPPEMLTVRYTPGAGFTGLTAFSFGAYDAANDIRIGSNQIVVLVTNVANTAPTLAAISNASLFSGQTLAFTNLASDAQSPGPALTFSLLNPPIGATVGSSNGVFHWRPTLAQGGTTNLVRVAVSDDGEPLLSATQSFTVIVFKPARPALTDVGFNGGKFGLSVSGTEGPDYTVLVSPDLSLWTPIWTTNSPALPFRVVDPLPTPDARRFYRVQLGP